MLQYKVSLKKLSAQRKCYKQQQRALKWQYKAAYHAIEADDAELLKSAILNINEFPESNTNQLIRAVIKSDDLDLFKVVYEMLMDSNPNHRLCKNVDNIDAGFNYEEKPILYIALNAKKQNIASFLLQQPEIDILATGQLEKRRKEITGSFLKTHSFNSKEIRYYPTPLETAKARKLDDVVEIMEVKLSLLSKMAA